MTSAVISPCGNYRYRLARQIQDGGGVVAFIGINPSTADASVDDATVRKWRGFASRWGFGGFVVGNLFAWRATNVRELASVSDPKGPDNDSHLLALMAEADVVVPCWGDRGKLPRRLRHRIADVRGLIRHCERPIRTLGMTASNDPKHPLMLAYATVWQDWSP